MLAITEFGLGHRRRSRAIWEDVLEDPEVTEAARVEALDWLDRIARAGETTEPIDGAETRVEDAAPLPPAEVQHEAPVTAGEVPVPEGLAPP